MEPFTVVASWTTPTSLFLLLNVVIGFIAVSSVFNSKKNGHPPPPDNHQIYHQEQPQRFVRAPSLFSRVTSFKFGAAPETENRPLITPVPSFLSRVTSFNSLYPRRSVESETVQVEESENSFNNSYLHRSVESETAPAEESETNRPSITPVPSFFSRMTSFNNRSVESEPIPVEESERAPSLLKRMASIKLSLQRSTDPVAEAEQHVTRSTTEPKVRKKKKVPTGKLQKSSSEKETASFGDGEVDAQADDFIHRFKQQLRMQRLDSLLRYRGSVRIVEKSNASQNNNGQQQVRIVAQWRRARIVAQWRRARIVAQWRRVMPVKTHLFGLIQTIASKYYCIFVLHPKTPTMVSVY